MTLALIRRDDNHIVAPAVALTAALKAIACQGTANGCGADMVVEGAHRFRCPNRGDKHTGVVLSGLAEALLHQFQFRIRYAEALLVALVDKLVLDIREIVFVALQI